MAQEFRKFRNELKSTKKINNTLNQLRPYRHALQDNQKKKAVEAAKLIGIEESRYTQATDIVKNIGKIAKYTIRDSATNEILSLADDVDQTIDAIKAREEINWPHINIKSTYVPLKDTGLRDLLNKLNAQEPELKLNTYYVQYNDVKGMTIPANTVFETLRKTWHS